MSDNESVLIYGLSTEGYMIASSLVSNSIPTIIIDEKLHLAISFVLFYVILPFLNCAPRIVSSLIRENIFNRNNS